VNTITIAGNVTRDPELKFLSSGAALATFGIAVNRRWKNQQTDQWDEEVSFFDVTCWRKLAENVTESLTKGSRVVVTGRLQSRSWENDNGEKRTKIDISADEVAASLKFATAQINRVERDNNFGSGGGGGANPAASSMGDPF
jgi:single-strand DNA-binding protein